MLLINKLYSFEILPQFKHNLAKIYVFFLFMKQVMQNIYR